MKGADVCLSILIRKNVADAREWVEEARKLPIKSFYATAVAKDTGLSYEKAFEECMALAEEGILEVVYEVLCPECLRCIKELKEPCDYTGNCEYCGAEDLEISLQELKPRFVLIRR